MKPIIESRTFWFNLITGVSVFLALPELQSLFGADALKYIVVVQSALNVVLRVMTSTAVRVNWK